MVYTLLVFLFKMQFFYNSNVFGSYIIHILYTGCAKIRKNNSGAKRLIRITIPRIPCFLLRPKNVITWRTVVFYLIHIKTKPYFPKLNFHNITLRNSHRQPTVR